jgi:hypothetical protein
MSKDLFQSLGWVGIAVAIVVVFLVIELVMRAVTNRYASRREGYAHRTVTQLPRSMA